VAVVVALQFMAAHFYDYISSALTAKSIRKLSSPFFFIITQRQQQQQHQQQASKHFICGRANINRRKTFQEKVAYRTT